MDIPQVRYVGTRDGGHVAYQVFGRGPDLVFHLGWPSQLLALWSHPRVAEFLHGLASFSRVILFDRRGTGLSDRGSTAYSFEDWADDINTVLDACGSIQCAHFGCHFGGRIALMHAATYPVRVSAVATFGAHPAMLKDDDYPWGAAPEETEALLQMIGQAMDEEGLTALFDRVAPSVASEPASARWWAHHFMSAVSPVESTTTLRAQIPFDIRQLLPSVGAATLLMHRKGDQMTDLRATQYMAERIPEARLVEIEGVDHLPFFEGTDAILAHVEELVTGARRSVDADRVLATVMFTDIVDSTPTASKLGDERWTEVLQQHNRIVDRELLQHRGTRIKTTGDGFLATFDGPARGVRCAQAICEGVRPLGVEVRAGLHAGEIELLGNDIGGIAVHIGQRVSGLAGPGEVLVSSTVKDLVSGSGIGFVDRGTHALKGIPDEWRIFAAEPEDASAR